jgi:hypothetical protein
MIQQSNANVIKQSSPPSVDLTRVRYGAGLVVAAFVLLGVIFGIAMAKFSVPADVATVVGSVATGVGTIVGAYFGVQVGSSGKEAAEAGRAQAERAARIALARLEPQEADQIMSFL